MDSSRDATVVDGSDASKAMPAPARRDSSSQQSENSQTAADFIREQMQLEQDAREALPYSIESCTKPLGSLRQTVFACLTCNPPPDNPRDPYKAAGVCYACSVQCHGEHTLVEIFTKRNFTCDCGTTRLPSTSPCSLRLNPETNAKGGVHSEEPGANNSYNQNFRNRFCGCECDYDPFQQKGTMFQCLGLGTHETGGCGEDWWHPGCVVGLGSQWFEGMKKGAPKESVEVTKNAQKGEATAPAPANGSLATISEDEAQADAPTAAPSAAAVVSEAPNEAEADADADADAEDDDPPMPPGFPEEDDFETFLCYKCVESNPWIKHYAGTAGFLPAVFFKKTETEASPTATDSMSKKRKADDLEDDESREDSKRLKNETESPTIPSQDPQPAATSKATETDTKPACKRSLLPEAPSGVFSLFMHDTFREHLCRCSTCFPLLVPHPQLLEEEETYEPPVSENGSEGAVSTRGSGSLYERGESALRNVDRVRAIEGVMAYNHLKDKLKPFFQEFAENGKAISAEDIKAYFAKLRGDEQGIKEAEDKEKDFRQEQAGY